MYLLISILGIFITIFFVIGTHECAHFFMARILGIKVLRFSIGFGKTLWRLRDKSGTEYIFALIPLGGYVQMLDEKEGQVPKNELHLAFNRQPYYKKFLVVVAGPLTNILCALILYWVIFITGFTTIKPVIGNITQRSVAAESGLAAKQEITHIDGKPTLTWTSVVFRILMHAGNQDHLKMQVRTPCALNAICPEGQVRTLDLTDWHLNALMPDPLKSLGITPYQPDVPLIIGKINNESPAASSELKMGDKIILLNQTKVNNWEQVIEFVKTHPDSSTTVAIVRNNMNLIIPIHIGYQRNFLLQKTGYLGIGPVFEWPKEMQTRIQYNALDAASHAWQTICDFTYFNLIFFGKLLTGKLSLQSVGGPIMIFQSAGDALNFGFLTFISFLAFLSISIGIINFLPIPGLDGGHLFIQTIEFIIRRPLPDSILIFLYRLGFILIFFILIQAIINDILRMY